MFSRCGFGMAAELAAETQVLAAHLACVGKFVIHTQSLDSCVSTLS